VLNVGGMEQYGEKPYFILLLGSLLIAINLSFFNGSNKVLWLSSGILAILYFVCFLFDFTKGKKKGE
jgi:hypothetical protein